MVFKNKHLKKLMELMEEKKNSIESSTALFKLKKY